ncbi:MAG: ABC transporter ATP-binding protein [Gemmatimonadaceae bacterium]
MRVIETRQLTKRFGSTLAVDGVSFSVEAGQVFGFLGPNGSGKTTTIGMLLGIITPTEGEFRLLGEQDARGLQRARLKVGATLETANFYPYLSGWDNLRLVANIKGVGDARIEAVLHHVGLLDRRADRFCEYSLGMKQRLAIAATLLGDPDLIILDEPTNGLDPEGMRETRDLIAHLASQGKTIFLSSHLLNEVERSCTHVAILKRGRIIRQASVRELLNGGTTVSIRAEGVAEALVRAAREYPGTQDVRRDGDDVVVRLVSSDSASLNRFLAERGCYVSRLVPCQTSLEDAFMDLTHDGPENPLR